MLLLFLFLAILMVRGNYRVRSYHMDNGALCGSTTPLHATVEINACPTAGHTSCITVSPYNIKTHCVASLGELPFEHALATLYAPTDTNCTGTPVKYEITVVNVCKTRFKHSCTVDDLELYKYASETCTGAPSQVMHVPLGQCITTDSPYPTQYVCTL